MGQVSCAQILHAEQVGDTPSTGAQKQHGLLKVEGKEYSVFAFTDSESVTEAVSQFLQDINEKVPLPSLECEWVHITQELVEQEEEITRLLIELSAPDEQESLETQARVSTQKVPPQPPVKGRDRESASPYPTSSPSTPSKGGEVVYTSLFSLARSFNTSLSQAKEAQKAKEPVKEQRETQLFSSIRLDSDQSLLKESKPYDQQEQEHKGGQDKGEQERHSQKKQSQDKSKNGKKTSAIGAMNAMSQKSPKAANPFSTMQLSRSSKTPRRMTSSVSSTGSMRSLGGVENVYIRFMALMARILGQAEAEAHELYTRIKGRTDHIDLLTHLISKVNSEKGAIDWTNNEEMKQLIAHVRAIGVDIPADKYCWSEEEKKLLKENIQMRKDSMEKMTQLERTDMQRFLQEASQCHQARSNVLKLLKEVMDTIIANMRP